MERDEAIAKIELLKGRDLRALADQYEVTVWRGDKKNKGWAGHVIERYLGLPINSAQAPNFGSWELKVVPLKVAADGSLKVKETMAITMIDPYEVKRTPFEESHLFRKMSRQVVVSRIFESQRDARSLLHSVGDFDLDDPEVYRRVKADYEEVQAVLRKSGLPGLTGAMGALVQPRTKGAGHGSTSRAFYARTQFVAHILGMEALPPDRLICP